MNHAVISGDDVPGRFHLPRSVGDFSAEHRAVGRALRARDQLSLRHGKIRHEALHDTLCRHRQVSLSIGAQLCEAGWRWEVLSEVTDRFADVGSERGHVDETGHFWIGARFGDHHPGRRMTDENNWTVLQRDRALRRGKVVF